MATLTFVERLASLETQVADLHSKFPSRARWLDRFIGAFEQEPAFDEVIRFGMEIRHADRPSERDREAS